MDRKTYQKPCHRMHVVFFMNLTIVTFCMVVSMLYSLCQTFQQQLYNESQQYRRAHFERPPTTGMDFKTFKIHVRNKIDEARGEQKSTTEHRDGVHHTQANFFTARQ